MNAESAKLGKVGSQGAAGVRHPDISPRIKCLAPVPSAWIASWMAAMSKTPGRRAFGRAEEERGCRWRRSRLLGCLDLVVLDKVMVVRPAPCSMMISLAHAASVRCPSLESRQAIWVGTRLGDMRLPMREREKKKRVRLLRLYGSIRAQRRVEARRGNRQKMRAMQGEKGGRVGFSRPRFGGIVENAILQMGLCAKCHHQPSRPLLQQRGGLVGSACRCPIGAGSCGVTSVDPIFRLTQTGQCEA